MDEFDAVDIVYDAVSAADICLWCLFQISSKLSFSMLIDVKTKTNMMLITHIGIPIIRHNFL